MTIARDSSTDEYLYEKEKKRSLKIFMDESQSIRFLAKWGHFFSDVLNYSLSPLLQVLFRTIDPHSKFSDLHEVFQLMVQLV